MVINKSIRNNMKRIYTIGWLISGLMLLGGCDISNRDNGLSEPLVYFINSGEVTEKLYDTGEDAVYNIPIFKSGLIEKSTNIELMVDETILKKFNQENNKEIQALPTEYYQIPTKTQAMEAAQQKANFQVIIKTSKLAKDPNRDNYILPLALISKGEVDINTNKSSILLSPSVQKTTIGFGEKKAVKMLPASASGDLEFLLPIETCFPNKWEINFDAAPQPSELDNWNSENNTGFATIMGENTYELTGDYKIAAGSNKQTIKLTVHLDLLPEGWSAIPIKITNPSKFEIDELQDVYVVAISKGSKSSPLINRSSWKIDSYSSQATGKEVATSMIDGNNGTWWSSKWSSPAAQLPQWIIVNMGKEHIVSAIEITRRTDQYNKDLKHGYFELSMDGKNWEKVTEFEFGTDPSSGSVPFYCPPTKCQYIKVYIDESNRTPSISIAELNAQGSVVN